MKRKNRIKEMLLNLVSMLFGLSVALLLAELASRLFVPTYLVKPHPKGLYSNDPDLGYVLSRNFTARHQHPDYDVMIHTNQDGLRGDDIAPKEPGTFRILVLGDSIAWGYGVEFEASFPRQLEKMLNQNLETPFQVINAAVPGYGTDQELGLLKKLAPSYQPDLIIVGFFIENDVYDNLIDGAQYRKVQDGYLIDWYRYERNKQENPLVVVTAFLSKKSYFYVFLRSFFRSATAQRQRVLPEFHPEAFPGFAQPDYLPVFAKAYGEQMERGMDRTRQLLQEIAQEGQRHQAQTLVVLFPSKVQVYPDLWERVQTVYHLDGKAYSMHKPDDILTDWGMQTGIPVLDLMPAFRQAGKDQALYLPTDLHQNATGQQLAARLVYEDLLDRNLIPH